MLWLVVFVVLIGLLTRSWPTSFFQVEYQSEHFNDFCTNLYNCTYLGMGILALWEDLHERVLTKI
jgi:hypothetical protein